MAKKTVKDLQNLKGKKVFVRVDYNVPMEGGKITDDIRIKAVAADHQAPAGAGLRRHPCVAPRQAEGQGEP